MNSKGCTYVQENVLTLAELYGSTTMGAAPKPEHPIEKGSNIQDRVANLKLKVSTRARRPTYAPTFVGIIHSLHDFRRWLVSTRVLNSRGKRSNAFCPCFHPRPSREPQQTLTPTRSRHRSQLIFSRIGNYCHQVRRSILLQMKFSVLLDMWPTSTTR